MAARMRRSNWLKLSAAIKTIEETSMTDLLSPGSSVKLVGKWPLKVLLSKSMVTAQHGINHRTSM